MPSDDDLSQSSHNADEEAEDLDTDDAENDEDGVPEGGELGRGRRPGATGKAALPVLLAWLSMITAGASKESRMIEMSYGG